MKVTVSASVSCEACGAEVATVRLGVDAETLGESFRLCADVVDDPLLLLPPRCAKCRASAARGVLRLVKG